MYAWFRKHEATNEYLYFDEGMATITQAIRDAGGVDAVIGFSQGAAVGGFVAAAMETARTPPEGQQGEWARKLREANGGRQLLFAVPYSGFKALPASLEWCYEPKIQTPTLHFVGSLDTVVDEDRSQALIDRCEDPKVIMHPGGHHVPVSKEWAMVLAGFIREHSTSEARSKNASQDSSNI